METFNYNFSNKISHDFSIDLKPWNLPSNSLVVGLSWLVSEVSHVTGLMQLSRGYQEDNWPGFLCREKWSSWWFKSGCLLVWSHYQYTSCSIHKDFLPPKRFTINHPLGPPKEPAFGAVKTGLQVSPDQFSYSASVSACHKCGRWNEALVILAKMKDPRWRFRLVGPWKGQVGGEESEAVMGIDRHSGWWFGLYNSYAVSGRYV